MRAFRRAKLRALTGVTDLYASDGAWEHRTPWGHESVPFSRLLSDTFERVGLGLLESRFLRGVPQALDLMESAAEPTIDGKLVIAGLRKELSGHTGDIREERAQRRY